MVESVEKTLEYFNEKAKKCGMTLYEYINATTPTQEQLEALIDRNKKIKERCVKMKDESLNTLKEIADELREKTPVNNFMEDLKRQEDEKLAKKEKFEREYPVIDEHAMNIEAEYHTEDWLSKTTTIQFNNCDLAFVLLAFHLYNHNYKSIIFQGEDKEEAHLRGKRFDNIFKSVRDQIIESDFEAIDYLGEYLSVNTIIEGENYNYESNT